MADRSSPEEGGEADAAQGGERLARQPSVLGVLAVVLMASSINEIKLGVPAVSIRFGLQVTPLQGAAPQLLDR